MDRMHVYLTECQQLLNILLSSRKVTDFNNLKAKLSEMQSYAKSIWNQLSTREQFICAQNMCAMCAQVIPDLGH